MNNKVHEKLPLLSYINKNLYLHVGKEIHKFIFGQGCLIFSFQAFLMLLIFQKEV